MAEQEQQLRLDLEELTHLQSLAKRPRVLSLLSSEIQSVTAQIQKAVAVSVAAVPAAAVSAPTAPAAKMNYVSLSSFSWDQDNDKLKIYISLEGVDREKVDAGFKSSSIDIKIHDVNGKNYRCFIPKLNKEIDPDRCKVLVKPLRIIITLQKASKGNWLDLYNKEDKYKPSTDKDKDPMSGIMDLMKNMYEDGDDDMKRTIAKAWTDARSGKTADPLNGSFR